MRRLLSALGLALLTLITTVPASFAAEDWCSDDPPMILTTPDEGAVPVYVLTTAPTRYVGSLAMATYRYTANHYVRDATGDLGTAFTVYVTVPNDLVSGAFGLHDAVSSGPVAGASIGGYQTAVASGYTYVSRDGTSGTTVALNFDYPQP